MWISWVDPRNQKRVTIYNYGDPDTPEGNRAIRVARRALSEKFSVPQKAIPGFEVKEAGWLKVGERHGG